MINIQKYFVSNGKHLFQVAALLNTHYDMNVNQIAANLENFKTNEFVSNPCEQENHCFKWDICETIEVKNRYDYLDASRG